MSKIIICQSSIYHLQSDEILLQSTKPECSHYAHYAGVIMLGVIMQCQYVECRYAECHYADFIMLSAILLASLC